MVAASAAAQNVTAGVKGGFVLNSIQNAGQVIDQISGYESVDVSAKTGLIGGGFVQFAFNEHISLQPEMMFVMKGVNLDIRDNLGTASANVNYLEFPIFMMTEVGNIYLDEAEAKNLREYLLKGGFLWADDFWGEYAWQVWDSQFRKVLPTGPYPYVDLPMNHPIFTQFFTVLKFPQIPSIGYWRTSGGGTSERADSRVPHARAVLDDHGRIMVLISHNTDFGDSFEEEATDRQYFIRFSVDGYAFGINALLYDLSH